MSRVEDNSKSAVIDKLFDTTTFLLACYDMLYIHTYIPLKSMRIIVC